MPNPAQESLRESQQDAQRQRRIIGMLNFGHAMDHLAMLIFPTAVLSLSAVWGRNYSELLPLALPGFIAFGAGSLPSG
ncbi:MAG: hypothetical protein MO853_10755 [Candidatus Protistobacter heckmanni]|nr:hypothetical protein [Candidatus Protistobacter heckmanni]